MHIIILYPRVPNKPVPQLEHEGGTCDCAWADMHGSFPSHPKPVHPYFYVDVLRALLRLIALCYVTSTIPRAEDLAHHTSDHITPR